MTNETQVPESLKAVEAETASNAALKQAVKQNAGTRAARRAEESPKPLPPPIPMPDDPVGIGESVDAEAEYADSIANAPAIAEATRKTLDDTYRVYVMCREQHLPHHPPQGIFLLTHPSGNDVPWNGWYSRYKKPNEKYYQSDVMCQACALEDRSTVLVAVEKTSPEGDLRVNPRFLMRVAKDRKRAMVEREHRVRTLGFASVNGGRADALARAKAAGFEVYDA